MVSKDGVVVKAKRFPPWRELEPVLVQDADLGGNA